MATPLEDLHAAIQEFVNSLDDEALLLHSAVVVWETVRYRDDGAMGHRICYACVVGSMSSAVGLLAIGHAQVLDDLRPGPDED